LFQGERQGEMLRDLVLAFLGLLWAVILLLVGARFVALLVDVNRDSTLVQRLYEWSEFWVQPFFGMLGLENRAVEDTGGVFEPASLVAFVVYLIIGAIVFGLLKATFFGNRYYRHA
jgi:hypothetical protein